MALSLQNAIEIEKPLPGFTPTGDTREERLEHMKSEFDKVNRLRLPSVVIVHEWDDNQIGSSTEYNNVTVKQAFEIASQYINHGDFYNYMLGVMTTSTKVMRTVYCCKCPLHDEIYYEDHALYHCSLEELYADYENSLQEI